MDNEKAAANKIQKILGEDFVVYESMDQNPMFKALGIEKVSMFIVTILIILVVIFNITTVLYVLTQSKSRDIGILKALGANSMDIVKTLVIFGARIGLYGATFGMALSLVFLTNMERIRWFFETAFQTNFLTKQVYFFEKIPYALTESALYIPILNYCIGCLSELDTSVESSKEKPCGNFTWWLKNYVKSIKKI